MREQLIKQMTDYVIDVLEEKRPEFSGLAVCPFVKADRLADQLHLDVFDNSKDTLVEMWFSGSLSVLEKGVLLLGNLT